MLYSYSALDGKGKTRKGVQEADSPKMLRQALRADGLAPVEVAPANTDKVQEKNSSSLFTRQANAGEIALITRQLATLVAAAIPLEECVQALIRQVQKAHLKSMLTAVRARVLEGRTLADALGAFPGSFDRLYRAMVAAGEKSGHLEVILVRLADYTEQRQQIRSKLIQAMLYPTILTLVAVAVVIALLSTVVPTVVDQFEFAGKELPGMTMALIAMSDFIRDHGIKLLAVIMMLLVVRQRLLRNAAIRLKYDRLMLRMPVFGSVFCGVDTARYARTLSILTSSTVPLVDAMNIAADVLSNRHIHKQLVAAAERVKEGSALWTSLDNTGLFPPMMLHIIASGERSGELDSMLLRAANAQDKLFENQVNIALGVFGPLMIVTMAGMVLFIVMAILTPMMDLNSLVGV
ncbi:type II secretion system protein GspF [Endozoicomonas sp. (ex Bugula neritina AB1)]|nr:type II secretion system protein GspF [Endozoicomonas sp. (ex Bugula neritina AB1)]